MAVNLRSSSRVDGVKVVLIGAPGVGKTSLTNQFQHGRFSADRQLTIGASVHGIKTDAGHAYIWDVAGQMKASEMNPSNFRGANAFLAVCEYGVDSTHVLMKKWIEELRTIWSGNFGWTPRSANDLPVPVIAVFNKTDLYRVSEDRKKELRADALECGVVDVAFTTATEHDNVKIVFTDAIRLGMAHRDQRPRTPPPSSAQPQKKCCGGGSAEPSDTEPRLQRRRAQR